MPYFKLKRDLQLQIQLQTQKKIKQNFNLYFGSDHLLKRSSEPESVSNGNAKIEKIVKHKKKNSVDKDDINVIVWNICQVNFSLKSQSFFKISIKPV